MVDSLTFQVAVLLTILAVAILATTVLLERLTSEFWGLRWGRRAEDRGVGRAVPAYRGPERRRPDRATSAA